MSIVAFEASFVRQRQGFNAKLLTQEFEIPMRISSFNVDLCVNTFREAMSSGDKIHNLIKALTDDQGRLNLEKLNSLIRCNPRDRGHFLQSLKEANDNLSKFLASFMGDIGCLKYLVSQIGDRGSFVNSLSEFSLNSKRVYEALNQLEKHDPKDCKSISFKEMAGPVPSLKKALEAMTRLNISTPVHLNRQNNWDRANRSLHLVPFMTFMREMLPVLIRALP